MAWVYILKCSDGAFYVGSTKYLEDRVDQHNSGFGASFTKKRRPVTLVFAQEYDNVGEAWQMERRLHGWSRAKKQALIDGRFELLPELSRRGRRRDRSGGSGDERAAR